MPPNRMKSFAALSTLLVSLVSTAALGSPLRFSAGLGIGGSSTKNETTASEGPLTQMYNFEYMVHSRLVVGAEHLRSLNLTPPGTGISFIGLFGRYYLNASPSPYASPNEVMANEIIIRDISYFVGGGVGLGQSSLLAGADGLSSNAAGIYLSPRGGAEMQLTRHVGLRGELMIATTVFGKGSISSFSLLGSVYYGF